MKYGIRKHKKKDEKEIFHLYIGAYVKLEKAKKIVEDIGWSYEMGKIHSLMAVFNSLMKNYLTFKKELPKYRKNQKEKE